MLPQRQPRQPGRRPAGAPFIVRRHQRHHRRPHRGHRRPPASCSARWSCRASCWQELQHIADDPDANKRNRGRRGLEMLAVLQKDHRIAVELTDEDVPEIEEVDAKLVALARRADAAILTTDYNLNRVAAAAGRPRPQPQPAGQRREAGLPARRGAARQGHPGGQGARPGRGLPGRRHDDRGRGRGALPRPGARRDRHARAPDGGRPDGLRPPAARLHGADAPGRAASPTPSSSPPASSRRMGGADKLARAARWGGRCWPGPSRAWRPPRRCARLIVVVGAGARRRDGGRGRGCGDRRPGRGRRAAAPGVGGAGLRRGGRRGRARPRRRPAARHARAGRPRGGGGREHGAAVPGAAGRRDPQARARRTASAETVDRAGLVRGPDAPGRAARRCCARRWRRPAPRGRRARVHRRGGAARGARHRRGRRAPARPATSRSPRPATCELARGAARGAPGTAADAAWARTATPSGRAMGWRLGGIVIAEAPRLHGHSDGDAALHAVADGLLGAAGLGDLGRRFPAGDAGHARHRQSPSCCAAVVADVAAAGWRPGGGRPAPRRCPAARFGGAAARRDARRHRRPARASIPARSPCAPRPATWTAPRRRPRSIAATGARDGASRRSGRAA